MAVKNKQEEVSWWSYEKKKAIMEGDLQYIQECTKNIEDLLENNGK